ncbi:hypothetical protein [Tardiphaga sp.]|uniref:hypothetical protein n=1 Tax=Tardiphaga sp. TaxID=1926292 RepID=UPI002631905B|nr:hypothetical protein [Tardiphaga sp.]
MSDQAPTALNANVTPAGVDGYFGITLDVIVPTNTQFGASLEAFIDISSVVLDPICPTL